MTDYQQFWHELVTFFVIILSTGLILEAVIRNKAVNDRVFKLVVLMFILHTVLTNW